MALIWVVHVQKLVEPPPVPGSQAVRPAQQIVIPRGSDFTVAAGAMFIVTDQTDQRKRGGCLCGNQLIPDRE
jgi:hypothetical protein